MASRSSSCGSWRRRSSIASERIKEIPVDIRIISATNKNLEREVDGKAVPSRPLLPGEHGAYPDPPAPGEAGGHPAPGVPVCGAGSQRRGQRFGGFTPAAERFLLLFPWPGNVRQLKNATERLVLMRPCGARRCGRPGLHPRWRPR